jgi:predicted transcriptional regulator
MGNRSRTEIVDSILDGANEGGTTKTKIMYYDFLSYNQLNKYLSLLIENNLIEFLDGTNKFKTTEKELKYLKMYNEIRKLLPRYLHKTTLLEIVEVCNICKILF